jgi:hypothetical protein
MGMINDIAAAMEKSANEKREYEKQSESFVYRSQDGELKTDINHYDKKGNCVEINTPVYYDNSKGSLYQFAENQNLNAYEFDIVKRIVRSRKKGSFREDLEKTKDLIDLYLLEYEELNRLNP